MKKQTNNKDKKKTTVVNARQYKRKRGPGSHADMSVKTSYVRAFPVSNRTARQIQLWITLQLVQIRASV